MQETRRPLPTFPTSSQVSFTLPSLVNGVDKHESIVAHEANGSRLAYARFGLRLGVNRDGTFV